MLVIPLSFSIVTIWSALLSSFSMMGIVVREAVELTFVPALVSKVALLFVEDAITDEDKKLLLLDDDAAVDKLIVLLAPLAPLKLLLRL